MFKSLLANAYVNLLINILVAAFLSIFVFVNVEAWQSSRDFSYLLVAGNESLFVLLYLIRERPRETSLLPLDWGIGFAGSFIGTILRPALQARSTAGSVLVIIGTFVNTVAVLSLNRSIGIVAALRSVKTRGLYAYIRHPMYAGELCVLVGYILNNLSLWNIAIGAANTILLLIRIDREETLLKTHSAYAAYAKSVRWRLIPFIY